MFVPYQKNKGYKIPLIVEFGQQNIRVGYAGADGPEIVMPSDYLMDNEGSMKFLQFNSTIQPPNYDVKNLIQNGQVTDFDVWKEFLDNIINTQLQQEKGFPFFLIEGAPIKKETRAKMIEVLFEDIEVSSVFFHRNTLLAQYLVARDNILVVDCGAYNTSVTPIIDGNIIEKANIRAEVGGEFLTQKLHDCWKRQNLRFSRYKNYDQLTPSMQQFGDMEVIREIKHQQCKLYDQPIEYLKFNPQVDNQVYELPDNSKLEISVETYKNPELLFEQSDQFEGFDRIIEQSLEKIDQDFRKELVQNVILIGGATCTVNMIERMQRTINSLKLFGLSSRSKVQTLPKMFDRQHATWLGGSIVASSQIYDQWTLTKSDFEEHGSALIEKKMFY